MKILITGAGGLLGSQAVRQLAENYEIHAIVRRAVAEPVCGVKYYVMDISNSKNLDELPFEVDVVIHLAQSSLFREFPDAATDIFNVNVGSTAYLLDYARRSKAQSFILASSGGIYGTGDAAFKENAGIPQHDQLGYYLGSKLCAEVLAQNYASLFNVTILRFFFMYGRAQKRSMLLPRLFDNVRFGYPITLQGKDGIRINPIHVSDAANALESCISLSGSHTFNIAGREVLSIRDIAQSIAGVVGRNPIFNIESNEPRHLVANIEAMEKTLSVPKVMFRQGVSDLFTA